VIAKPKATNNKIEPKLNPVNKAPKRSPQASADWISANEACICALTAASVSFVICWFNSNWVLGVLLLPNALAAASRTAASGWVILIAA
jgi:hypothetical protein